jgi:hypothetical protein
MEESIGWIIIVIAVIVLLIAGISYAPAAIYLFLTVLGTLIALLFDQLFSASLLPGAPWVMWLLGGALIGAAFAFWTLAPVYGLRKQRPLILATPFILLLLLAALRLIVYKT